MVKKSKQCIKYIIPLGLVLGTAIISVPKIIEWYKNSKILTNNIFETISTNDSTFYISDRIESIIDVNTEYQYYDIRKSDIVMDIGACIGAFSLKVSNKVNKVYSIEPIMLDSLYKNIFLNNKQNIIVLETSLGNGLQKLNYNNITKYISGNSLNDLINISGGHIDFLKLDCEGGEWCIKPEELINIRRIEAEVHSFDSSNKYHDMKEFENTLKFAGFDYTKNIRSSKTTLIHAKNRYIT